jgi:tetratricopeptide (TPR) repeat protein
MKKPKQAPEAVVSGVVVSPSAAPSSHKNLILGAVLIVVCIIAAMIWSEHVHHERMIAEDVQNYNSDIQQSMAFRALHEYPQAISPLQNYVTTGLNNSQKVYALLNIANIYEQQQNNSAALKSYRQAESLNGQTDNATKNAEAIDIGIARTSDELGDTQTALSYYKKCLPLLQNQTGYSRAVDISDVQQRITAIEAAT